jgi:hypothetical protein
LCGHTTPSPRVTLTTSAETSTGQGATPLLSAGVLSNGQIRTPGPFRRGVLLSGGRRSATENGTGVARHTFCSYCGMHAFYVPRSQPDRITVNARCLDGIDGPSLKPSRFFEGRHWEEAQRSASGLPKEAIRPPLG